MLFNDEIDSMSYIVKWENLDILVLYFKPTFLTLIDLGSNWDAG
jgi:hypothetical protein